MKWNKTKLGSSTMVETNQVQRGAPLYLHALPWSQGRHLGCMPAKSGPSLETPSKAWPEARQHLAGRPRERPIRHVVIACGGRCHPCFLCPQRSWGWHPGTCYAHRHHVLGLLCRGRHGCESGHGWPSQAQSVGGHGRTACWKPTCVLCPARPASPCPWWNPPRRTGQACSPGGRLRWQVESC